MEITSPSGRVYQWNKDTPPSEADMAALVEFDAAQPQAEQPKMDPYDYALGVQQQLSESFPEGRGGDPNYIPKQIPVDTGAANLSVGQKIRESSIGRGLLGPTSRQEIFDEGIVQSAGYDAARMQDEVGLLEKAKNKAINTADIVGEMGVQGLAPSMAQTFAAEVSGPFAPYTVPLAGATVGAGTNALVQGKRMFLGQQQGFNKGEMAASGVASALPGGSIMKAGLGAVAREAAKGIVVNNVALATQNAIDTDPQYQKLVSASQQALQAGDAKAAEELKNLALNYRFKQHAFATAAGVLGPTLSKYLDKQSNKLAKDVQKAALAGSTELELVQRVQAEGFKLPPNILNKENRGMVGKINKMMLNTASPSDTIATMMDRNQKIQQELIRKQMYETPYGKQVAAQMGLDTSTPFTDEILDRIKQAANAPYAKIDSIAANARKEIEMLKQSVFTVPAGTNAAFKLKALKATNTPEAQKLRSLQEQLGSQHLEDYLQAKETLTALRKAKAAPEGVKTVADHVRLRNEIKQQAEVVSNLESKLRSAVKEAGHPELLNELIEARRIQAQVEVIKDAMTGGVNVDATKLAASNAPLTGNLKLVADFQNNFGKYLGDAANVKPVDSGKLSKLMFGSVGAGVGSLTAGQHGVIPGAIIGGAIGEMIPGRLQGTARETLLSKNYQRYMTKPNYGYTIPDFNARAAKYMLMQAGRPQNNQ